MDLQTRKIEFIQEFLKVQSEEVIARLEKILHNENKYTGQEDLKPMTVQEFNHRIAESMNDSENGRLIKAIDLESDIEKWV
jgi:hypothetical protein